MLQVNLEFDNEDNERVLLLVRDTKPPFLTGKTIFSKQSGPVMPLRDPTSDMAVIARQGSLLVKETREKKEKNKFRQRFWEVAGSKMGAITGLTGTEREEERKAKEEEVRTRLLFSVFTMAAGNSWFLNLILHPHILNKR